jgi:cytoskeletal protein CcmA (bactofilin family)
MLARNLALRLITGLFFTSAAALSWGETDGAARVRVTNAGDLYAAGGNVEVTEPVKGDVFIAAGRVLLTQPVMGDAFIAGGNVRINEKLGEGLFAAGANVVIEGDVGRHARVAGGDVTIARGATVGGKATLGGAHVEVGGRVGKDLTIAADSARINGRIDGSADVSARHIELGPDAVITGKLTYWSPQEATIDPAAKIGGGADYRPVTMPEGMHTAGIVALMMGKLFLLVGLMVMGSLLVLLFPNFTGTVERAFTSNPGKSIALGIALLIGLPIVGVLFMITLLGIPLGLTVFFLYPLILMLGYLTAAFFIGDRGMSYLRKGRDLTTGVRILGFVAALLALALIGALPIVGGLIVFFLLVGGMGAWAMALYERYHTHKIVVSG